MELTAELPSVHQGQDNRGERGKVVGFCRKVSTGSGRERVRVAALGRTGAGWRRGQELSEWPKQRDSCVRDPETQ